MEPPSNYPINEGTKVEKIKTTYMTKIDTSVRIVVSSLNHDFENDKRILIPFIQGSKFGFCDKNREVVIPPSYDIVLDDFNHQFSLVRVGKYIPVSYPGSQKPYLRLVYGLIDSKGKFVIPLEYEGLAYPECAMAFTVRSVEKGYAVFNESGECIVPFDRYAYIDGFTNGYARVKIGKSRGCTSTPDDRWGIIDEQGKEVLKPTYNVVKKFYKSNNPYTLVKAEREVLEFHLLDGKLHYAGYFNDQERQAQKEMEDYESLCHYKESQSDIEDTFDSF
jgi:hypothetical protein